MDLYISALIGCRSTLLPISVTLGVHDKREWSPEKLISTTDGRLVEMASEGFEENVVSAGHRPSMPEEVV